MANLRDDLGVPGHWQGQHGCVEFDADGQELPRAEVRQCSSFKEHMDRESECIDVLTRQERIYRQQIADGYAYYYVHSEDPLDVIHVPYVGGYDLPAPHVRGLLLEDIVEAQNRERGWREMFDQHAAAQEQGEQPAP